MNGTGSIKRGCIFKNTTPTFIIFSFAAKYLEENGVPRNACVCVGEMLIMLEMLWYA